MNARAMRRAAVAGAAALAAAVVPAIGQAAPQRYEIDPDFTHVHFEYRHFGTSTSTGRFDGITGQIAIDREAGRGDVQITIGTASVSTGFAPLDRAMRGPYALSTDAYPRAYFVSTRVVFDGDRIAAVEGVLTLRDIGRALTLKALRYACRPRDGGGEVCGGDFETEFRRSAFEVTHSLPFVGDDVRLLIQVEAVRR